LLLLNVDDGVNEIKKFLFNYYFKNEGFKLTNVRCNNNSFLIKTYKKL